MEGMTFFCVVLWDIEVIHVSRSDANVDHGVHFM